MMSARAVSDDWLEGEIVRVYKESGERSGASKVWWDCTASTLRWPGAGGAADAPAGMRGVRRGGYKVVTTVLDSSQHRPGDLDNRDYRAVAPNRLWVVDFTYIATCRDSLHRGGQRRVLPDDRRVEERRATTKDDGAGRPGQGGRGKAP